MRDVHDWCLLYFHFRKYNEEKRVILKKESKLNEQLEYTSNYIQRADIAQSNCQFSFRCFYMAGTRLNFLKELKLLNKKIARN